MNSVHYYIRRNSVEQEIPRHPIGECNSSEQWKLVHGLHRELSALSKTLSKGRALKLSGATFDRGIAKKHSKHARSVVIKRDKKSKSTEPVSPARCAEGESEFFAAFPSNVFLLNAWLLRWALAPTRSTSRKEIFPRWLKQISNQLKNIIFERMMCLLSFGSGPRAAHMKKL